MYVCPSATRKGSIFDEVVMCVSPAEGTKKKKKKKPNIISITRGRRPHQKVATATYAAPVQTRFEADQFAQPRKCQTAMQRRCHAIKRFYTEPRRSKASIASRSWASDVAARAARSMLFN
jgi:hypothetical protein